MAQVSPLGARTALVAAAAMLVLACGGDGPSGPDSHARHAGDYSLADVTDGIGPSGPYRFNDRGDVLTWDGSLISAGVRQSPPGACRGIAFNNHSHVLCAVDQNQTTGSYALWNGSTITPLAGLDTFVAVNFTAWAVNDSDAVVAVFHQRSFNDSACDPTACVAIWRNGRFSFPPLKADYVSHLNNRFDIIVQYPWPYYQNPVLLYVVSTGKTRLVISDPGLASELNDSGWVVGTHGGPDFHLASSAVLTRPDTTIVLGNGEASGINNAGAVVGTLDSGAFLWKDGVSTPLTFAPSDTTWTVTQALRINNGGQILAVADDSAQAKFGRWVILTPIAH
jgi:hypothetical protein